MSLLNQTSSFEINLPPVESFPLNADGQPQSIKLIREDLDKSKNYLIITGYTSLEYLIKQFGENDTNCRRVDVVLGNEPIVHELMIHQKLSFQKYLNNKATPSLTDEIRTFWINQGISILLNGAVISLIEKIKRGEIGFYYKSNLHAKIYAGDNAVMLGSSNFSRPGLESQHEANARFKSKQSGFKEVKDIAEYYRKDATEWNDALIDLLKKLLREMSWQETLSRAVALITEGEWIDKYPLAWQNNWVVSLWPTQKKGIAQALYLLDRQGSVLIADPTGSGKTKMGARLLEALLNRLWQQLKQHRTRYQIVCPPLVRDAWEKELGHLDWNTSLPVSHGLLSNPNNEASEKALETLKKANILLIDEAHNYLNKKSARSRSVIINRADHIVLFTATPINRKSDDLLRLVEILGLDNLDDKAYKIYRDLLRTKDQRSPEKMDQLKRYINRFMVRRTKKELNEAIDNAPSEFRDEFGKECRFPVCKPKTYRTNETEKDKKIAGEIEERIKSLKGIIYLANLKADAWERATVDRQRTFLKKRFHMAPALTRYNIRNKLRSSRAALTEHLLGTEKAMEVFGVDDFKKNETGNIISNIKALRSNLPKTNLTIELPGFIKDRDKWQESCDKEIEILLEIAALCQKMSDQREQGKAEKITQLIEKEGMLLIYDTALITLNMMHQLLQAKGYGDNSFVVTGSTAKSKKDLKEKFALKAEHSKNAALCSDALAEGVNLQRAKAVMFLDMPSVIRIAEQRIGRVERMDSPHKEITVYWPDDSEAFRLKTDRNFYHRHQMVEDLIGSNIRLPNEMMTESFGFEEEVLSTEQVIEKLDEHQKEDRSWEGFEDAFSSMRALVEGGNALLSEDVFDNVRKQDIHNSGAWICVVKCSEPFVFAAVDGHGASAPYWILKRHKLKPTQEINEIVRFLRKQLPNSESTKFESQAEQHLKDISDWLKEHERDMLPNKKKNALAQMQKVLPKWIKNSEDIDHKVIRKSKQLLNLVEGKYDQGSIDYYELANRWLDISQPILINWLDNERRNRKKQNIRLQDINPYLIKNPFSLDELDYILSSTPKSNPVEKRIKAMIIGIPRS